MRLRESRRRPIVVLALMVTLCVGAVAAGFIVSGMNGGDWRELANDREVEKRLEKLKQKHATERPK